MKKIMKSLLCLTLCAVSLFGVACKKETEKPSNTEEPGYIDTGIVLAENGKTDYSVVIPANASKYEEFAASELTMRFEEATGAELPVLYDSDESVAYSETAKLISISDTTVQKASGVTADYATYKASGARMVTKGSCVILTGGSEQGALYAVYDFLGVLFDYEYVCLDTYVLTHKEKVTLPKLDESNIPDFDYRVYSDYRQWENSGGSIYEAYRMRLNWHDDGWAIGGHAVDTLLPYTTYADQLGHTDWYDTHGPLILENGQKWIQLCYSNEEMRKEFVERVKYYLNEYPEATLMGFGQSDVNSWCGCAKCTETMDKYDHDGMVARGAITQTLFVNKVVEEIEAWLATEYPERQVRYMVFAYHQTITAPAHKDANGNYIPNGAENGDYSMKLHDKVYVSYADIYANRNKSWRENPTVSENLRAWAACTKSVQIYEYGADAANAMLPYDGIHVFAENFRFAQELGFSDYFFEGAGSGVDSGFTALKYYVASRLMWDSTLDVNDVIAHYIQVSYGPAAEEMQEFYDVLRTRLSFLRETYGFGSMVLSSTINAAHWPRPVILSYYEMFDKMYEEIEPLKYIDAEEYEKVFRKIKIEELFVDFVNLSCYLGYYSAEEKAQRIDEFEHWCTTYGATYMGSGKSFSDILAGWRASI